MQLHFQLGLLENPTKNKSTKFGRSEGKSPEGGRVPTLGFYKKRVYSDKKKLRAVKITEKISRLARFYFLPTLNPGDAPARYKYYKQYLRTNITQVIIYEENI